MLEAIYSRRSIRKYADELVSCSTIEKIIDAGRVALSAKNRQPWKYPSDYENYTNFNCCS